MSFAQKARQLKKSGLVHEGSAAFGTVGRALQRINAKRLKPEEMICFIMYDVEDNKIRNHIAKYLIKRGCERIQKSVYMARTTKKAYEDMARTLAEVNEVYDNNDSILLLPLGVENIERMKVIGKDIDKEVVIKKRNTLII